MVLGRGEAISGVKELVVRAAVPETRWRLKDGDGFQLTFRLFFLLVLLREAGKAAGAVGSDVGAEAVVAAGVAVVKVEDVVRVGREGARGGSHCCVFPAHAFTFACSRYGHVQLSQLFSSPPPQFLFRVVVFLAGLGRAGQEVHQARELGETQGAVVSGGVAWTIGGAARAGRGRREELGVGPIARPPAALGVAGRELDEGVGVSGGRGQEMGLDVVVGVGVKLERGVTAGLVRSPDGGGRAGDEVVLLQGVERVTGGAEEDSRVRVTGVGRHGRLLLGCLDLLLVARITGRHLRLYWLSFLVLTCTVLILITPQRALFFFSVTVLFFPLIHTQPLSFVFVKPVSLPVSVLSLPSVRVRR